MLLPEVLPLPEPLPVPEPLPEPKPLPDPEAVPERDVEVPYSPPEPVASGALTYSVTSVAGECPAEFAATR